MGDLCNILGQNQAFLDEKIFFIGGNLSFVTASSEADVEHYPDLYWLKVEDGFPVEATIPFGLLQNETIPTDISGAVHNAQGTGDLFDPAPGALFNDKENLYVYGGVPDDLENNVLAKYELSSDTWSNVTVSGRQLQPW